MTTEKQLSWLLQTWTDGLNNELTGIGISGFSFEDIGNETELADPDVLWRGQGFNVLDEPGVWIGAGKSASQHLGTYLEKQAGIENPDEAAAVETWGEILGKSLAALASELSARLDRDITCTETTDEPPPADQTSAARVVQIVTPDEIRADVCLVCSPGLMRLLDEGSAAELNSQAAEPGNPAVDFDSILDLDMPISVTLGSARIDLQRALNLAEGSVSG